MTDNYKCLVCRNWDALSSNPEIGRCRKNPPVANKQQNKVVTGEWPTTYASDWCDALSPKR